MNIEAESGDAFEIPDLWKPSSLISSSSGSLLFSRLNTDDVIRNTTIREIPIARSLAALKDYDAFKLLEVDDARNHDIGGFFASPFAEEKPVEDSATSSAPDIQPEPQSEHVENEDPWQLASVVKPDNSLHFYSWDTFYSQLPRFGARPWENCSSKHTHICVLTCPSTDGDADL